MREFFNYQLADHGTAWVPAYGSPETLARTALIRILEGRLAVFGDHFTSASKVVVLTTTFNWSSNYLGDAINEIKAVLVAEASE